jgi:pimeloyl-ACP methyl ester carboxylesterase
MRFIKRLVRELDITVYAIFIPGHGPSLSTQDFMAAVGLIAQALEALGLEQVPVLGHSLGGLMTCRLAQGRPDLVSAVGTLCMPSQHPRTKAGYYARIAAVTIDVFATSILAVLTTGNAVESRALVRALYWTIRERFDAPAAVQLLIGSPPDVLGMLRAIEVAGLPQQHYQGRFDLPARRLFRPATLPGEILVGTWGHNAPLLPWAYPHIADLVRFLFGEAPPASSHQPA